MRKVVIGFYITTILLISAFSRANSIDLIDNSVSQLPIATVKYDASQFKLHLFGYFSTPCQTQPRPTLVNYSNDVVTLAVIAKNSSEACIQRISGRYDVAFDLRSFLAQYVPSSLGRSTTIKFVNTLAYTSPIKVDLPSYLVRQPFSNQEVNGVLQQSVSASVCGQVSGLVVVTKDGFSMPVVDVPFNFDQYVGKNVHVSGLVFKKSVQPVQDDLTAECEEMTRPSIFVTGLSISAI